jgi:hypothetical protein
VDPLSGESETSIYGKTKEKFANRHGTEGGSSLAAMRDSARTTRSWPGCLRGRNDTPGHEFPEAGALER